MICATRPNLPNQYFYNKTHNDRSEVPGTPEGVVKCRDGYLAYFVYSYNWPAACSAFGVPELATDPRYAGTEARAKVWSSVTALFEKAASIFTAAELEARLVAAGVPVAKGNTPADLFASDHLAARDWWYETEGGEPVIGPPFRVAGFEWGRRGLRQRHGR